MFRADGFDPSVKTTLMIAAAMTKVPEHKRSPMINFLRDPLGIRFISKVVISTFSMAPSIPIKVGLEWPKSRRAVSFETF